MGSDINCPLGMDVVQRDENSYCIYPGLTFDIISLRAAMLILVILGLSLDVTLQYYIYVQIISIQVLS